MMTPHILLQWEDRFSFDLKALHGLFDEVEMEFLRFEKMGPWLLVVSKFKLGTIVKYLVAVPVGGGKTFFIRMRDP